MRKSCMAALALLLAANVWACSPQEPEAMSQMPGQSPPPGGGNAGDDPELGRPEDQMKLTITVGMAAFSVTLVDNEAACAFKAMLPMKADMTELNGNEKYCQLSHVLPTAAARPGSIHSGDIMLYGTRTLVVFYKTFSTSHSYTPIGRIDNPAGLEAALGTGNPRVTFACAP